MGPQGFYDWDELDFYDFEYFEQPTDWERKLKSLNVSAPDPDDLCEFCGRSQELCDC